MVFLHEYDLAALGGQEHCFSEAQRFASKKIRDFFRVDQIRRENNLPKENT